MRIFDYLKDAFYQGNSFRDGVEQTSEVPVVFIDADRFNPEIYKDLMAGGNGQSKVTPEDIAIAREMLDSQIEKISLQAFGSRGDDNGYSAGASDQEIKDFIINTVVHTPSAMSGLKLHNSQTGQDQEICIVTDMANRMDHKDELRGRLAGRNDLDSYPAPNSIVIQGIGVHEGMHCNQVSVPSWMALAGDSFLVMTASREAQSDQAQIEFFKEAGYPEMAQALIDDRVLSSELQHATGSLIGPDGPKEMTQENLDAVRGFQNVMMEAVAEYRGMSVEDVDVSSAEDPRQFVEDVERLHNAGVFDKDKLSGALNGNAYVEPYIQLWTGAMRRQVLDKPEAAPIHGPGSGRGWNSVKADEPGHNTTVAMNGANRMSAMGSEAYMPSALRTKDPIMVDLAARGEPQIVHTDTSTRMQVGDVGMSEFFQSHSDPAAAQQRQQLEAEQQQQLAQAPVESAPSRPISARV